MPKRWIRSGFELRTSNFLGVDVGGTTTRVGLLGVDARPSIADRFPTPGTVELLLDRIVTSVETTSWRGSGDGVEPDGIGVALPGLIDRDRGVLLRSVHLPFLEQVPIVHELHRRTSLRTVLMTDAEAATWGEYSACNPRPVRFVHLRFGTGIACGIVVRGELQPTDPNRRTHLPALVVEDVPDTPTCACGLRGCLELFASGPVIAQKAARLGLPSDLSELQSAVDARRANARDLIEAVAAWIVHGIRNLADPLPYGRGSENRVASAPRSDGGGDLTVFCLGGGVLAALPALFDCVCELWLAQQRGAPTRTEVRVARLGDDGGVLGAAMLAGARYATRGREEV